MGFRINTRRIKIFPGITMNLSKTGTSFSFGPRGLKYTVGPKGVRSSFGIPGTGVYYTTSKKWNSSQQSVQKGKQQSVQQMGLLQKLFLSDEEKAFFEGINLLSQNQKDAAYQIFIKHAETADCSFMAGYLAMGYADFASAERFFVQCRSKLDKLGTIATKLQNRCEFLLEITKYIDCPIHLDKKGLFLALAESYQHQKMESSALSLLRKLNDEIPEDKIVILSLMEISAVSNISTTGELTDLLIKTKFMENNEPVDTNILYYRAYISYKLGLRDPAIEQLTKLLQKRKGIPIDLLLDIRYLRGRIYEELGNLKKSKADYQVVYANDPNYKDVSTRLH